MSSKPECQSVSIDEKIDPAQPNQPTKPISYVSTGTGFFLGLWKPGQVMCVDVPEEATRAASLSYEDIKSLIFLTLLSLAVRFWEISNPPNIVHEEAIQLQRINNYMSGRFFFDLHPPLVSELYTLAAHLFGYTGKFAGYSNSYIGHSFPYIELRAIVALLGIVSIVASFLTLKLTGASRMACILAGIFVCFESSFAFEHRFIFTMPISLTLLSITIYLWKLLELKQPLSLQWHTVAIALGTVIGLKISTQLSSVYTLYWVMLASAYQLWWSFGNKFEKHFFRKFIFNLMFRVVYLFCLPYLIYNVTIAVHLQLTPASGEGDSAVTGPFENTLLGSPGSQVVKPIGIGSFVTLRHLKTNVYLHSHDAYYQQGSYQQQVTGYGYRDSNNYWMIENITDSGQTEYNQLKNETYIKFRHLQTLKRLHSHKKRPPVTDADWQFEVTAYGAEGFPGDLNDLWKIETVNLSKTEESKSEIHAIDTVFRLRHLVLGCYLLTHPIKLPEYGFEQQEVTCAYNANPERTYWYFETNYHPMHSSDAPVVSYDWLSFADKMEEYKGVMEKAKTALYEKTLGYDVSPWQLPFLLNGTPIHRNHYRQIMLFGNVTIWYLALIGMVFYGVFKIYTLLAVQANWRSFQSVSGIKEFDHHAGGFLIMYLCHYIPIFFEQQDHTTADYLPALYCTILLLAKVWDFTLTAFVRRKSFHGFLTFILAAFSISAFLLISPFVYNAPLTVENCQNLEVMPSWDFGCNYYLDTSEQIDDYNNQHETELIYRYEKPPAEELMSATIAYTAARANPTQVLGNQHTYTKEEVALAIENLQNVTKMDKNVREQLLHVDHQQRLIKDINEKIRKRKVAAGWIDESKEQEEKKEEEKEGDKATKTINSSNVAKIQADWLRITDPPSVNFTGQAYDDMLEIEKRFIKSQSEEGIESSSVEEKTAENKIEEVEENQAQSSEEVQMDE